jgi:PepSY-associated TM region
MANGVWRAMVMLHRYAGIAIGLLMVVWFVSGIVMMYVPYSLTQEAERLRMQPPIPWQSCCNYGALSDDAPITRAQVADHLGVLVMRLSIPGRADYLFDLVDGVRVPIDADAARRVVLQAAPAVMGRPASIIDYEQVSFDQFTLGRAPRDRPFHRFAFDDPDRTVVYVSGTTGQIVTWTTAGHRFWNWLGTIPHFLYFESLRVQPQLWSQTVIWTSLLGAFLTLVGIILGVAQFGRGKGGRLSPYRGWFYWHHMSGLVFGVLTLTWVFSGFVSMNPWGFLQSRGSGEGSLIQGTSPRWKDIKVSLETLHVRLADSGAVSLAIAPLGGRLYWMAIFHDGSTKRFDASGAATPMSEGELAEAGQRVAGNHTIAEQGLMHEEDSYYYAHRRRRFDEIVLPIYRVILNDSERTRYYLDPNTGALVYVADSAGRWRRWLFSGLHRLDFAEMMRVRPFRDIVMWLTLLGGLGVSVTGVYLAFRRVRSDFIVLLQFARRLTTACRAGNRSPLSNSGPQQ